MGQYYRVVDASTNTLVVEGSANECAKNLNMPRSSFYSFVFRMKDNRKAKYNVEVIRPENYTGTKRRHKYIVVNKKTNEVAASGDASECAEALSLSVRSFYDVVSRVKKGTERRYDVTID